MNFIQFSFSSAYIYSPITWLHKIRANYKIFIIFSLLFIVPYLTLSYLLIFTLTFLIIILTLKFRQNYYHSCFSILIATLICLLPYSFNKVNYFIYNPVKIYTPYQIYNVFIKHKSIKKITSIDNRIFIQLKIPEFMMQTGVISILYSIILKTLLLTTMYEHIILSLCMYIKMNNHYIKKMIFISSFASQFLEQMVRRIRTLHISIKLRNINLIIDTNKFLVFYYIVAKFLNHLKYDIYKVTSVLYSREFSDQSLEMSDL